MDIHTYFLVRAGIEIAVAASIAYVCRRCRVGATFVVIALPVGVIYWVCADWTEYMGKIRFTTPYSLQVGRSVSMGSLAGGIAAWIDFRLRRRASVGMQQGYPDDQP